MKIGTNTLDSQYRNRIDKKSPFEKKGAGGTGKNRTENRNGPDLIDLSTGFSLEKIQGFLQTEIGKKIDNMMAEAGVDFTAAAGLDWSPEATSDRIFDMATGLFGIWRDQHPEQSEKELIESFEKVMRSSVDKGASEAISLIGTAGFGDETHEVTEKTMSLLHGKLDGYFADLRKESDDSGASSTDV